MSLRPARPLRRSHANLKALEVTGKGCKPVLDRCCWRMETMATMCMPGRGAPRIRPYGCFLTG